MQFIGADGQLKEQFIDTDGSIKFRNVGSDLQFTPFQDNMGIVNADLIQQLIERNKPSNIFNTSTFLAKQQAGRGFEPLDRSARAAKEADFASGIMGQVEFEPSFQGLDYDEDATGIVTEDNEEEKGGFLKGIQNYLDNAGIIGTLINSILRPKESPMYRPAGIGVYGYTPRELDRMNALGGYYSEPMRAYRRNVNRISNLMRRAAADKNYSQKNLDKLMSQVGMSDVDTRGMIDSIKASADLGYGKGGGRDFDSGRDYSSSPGAIAGDMEYGEE